MSTSLDEIERVFLALGDKTRIKLVGLMRDGEVSVNYLCQSLGESQPKVSRHLAYLRSMGMVKTRKEGKWVYYSLAELENQFGTRMLEDTLDWIGTMSRGDADLPPARVATAMPSRPAPEINIYAYTDTNADSCELEVYLL